MDPDLRIRRLDPAQHPLVVLEAELRVVPSLQKDLGTTGSDDRPTLGEDLVLAEQVLVTVVEMSVECTELAIDVTDVGVGDVTRRIKTKM